MRKKLLSVPVAIITFVIAIYFIPFDPSAGVRGFFARAWFVRSAQSDYESVGDRGRVSSEYYGLWADPNDNMIEIHPRFVRDRKNDEAYRYHVIGRFGSTEMGHGAYLLQFDDVNTSADLRPFVYVNYDESGLTCFGYDSFDDFEMGRASSTIVFQRAERFGSFSH